MTNRADIAPTASGFRRLSYTRRRGWIDWGHASPGNASALLRAVANENRGDRALLPLSVTLDGRPAYLIEHGEQMGLSVFRARTSSFYAVAKGLSAQDKNSVALSILLASSVEFETMQNSLPYSLWIDSGFSAEDLTSNLVGFYAALYHIPSTRLRGVCGEVSVEESCRILDKYLPGGLGAVKRRTARPLLSKPRRAYTPRPT